MKSKRLAAQDLLNSAIHNQLAQAALGAGASYLGAKAFNHISPVDIDPEMALAVGAFGAPMLMRRRAAIMQQRGKGTPADVPASQGAGIPVAPP